tara:strand:- start:42361 stop:42894 length:534 start_codon:yes stop_codon:yes gene_type:complete
MSEHIHVNEDFVNSLVSNAAWDAARVPLQEGDKKGDKSKDKPEDKPDFTTDARKGDKGKGKDKDDKPDFTTDMRKGDKSKTKPGKKDFEDDKKKDKDEMKEGVEEHVCPLCESHLDEALSDEAIFEHVSEIQEALQDLEEAAAAAPKEDDEDDLEEEAPRRANLLKKIAAMKDSASK